MKRFFAPALALSLTACGTNESANLELTREELLDPETCAECHPKHYEEWSGSMHAYASFDPVFRAMNARGQEETADREQPLGDFCVNCHAPMAVREGKTTDGLNLDDVDKKYQGVTCYFCHNVQSVDGTHNNPLVLANDRTMRGAIRDPLKNTAHHAEYSELLDGDSLESSKMCGACHDIVVPKEVSGNDRDVHLERTFLEWQGTIMNDEGPAGRSCASSCHMPISPTLGPIAEYDGVTSRVRHTHSFPGVDVAITDFPQLEEQRRLVQDFLDTTLRVMVCAGPLGTVVELDNVFSGHNYPSGASQDRRVWVEVIAYDFSGNEIFSSGKVEDGEDVTALDDEHLWILRDHTTKADGSVAHMFWDVADYESTTLPGVATLVQGAEGFEVERQWRVYPIGNPGRVAVRLRVQPIGVDVLDDLVRSGHLEARFRDAMPTFDVIPNRNASPDSGLVRDSTVEWTPERARGGPVTDIGGGGTCVETGRTQLR